MALAPFTIDPARTQISIAYTNRAFIADRVLPRTGVGKQEFTYALWDKDTRFYVPQDEVGRRSRPNEVEFGYRDVPEVTRDHALDDPIPSADIENTDEDLVGQATEGLTELIMLGREARVAGLVFDEAQYPAGYKVTLSGTSQWSDYTNSNPIDDIMTGLDVPLMRPNVMALGQQTATKLVQHPDIVTAVNGANADAGVATLQQLANLFMLDEVVVGAAKYNSSAKGQTLVQANLWGKHALLFYRNPSATVRRGVTFGLTGQWRTRIAQTQQDGSIGAYGGTRVRVAESVKEFISSNDSAYFIEDAVA